MRYPPYYPYSVNDETYRYNSDNSRPISPDSASSCISSLLADEIPHCLSSVNDQACRYNSDNSRPISPNVESLCISSLSADEIPHCLLSVNDQACRYNSDNSRLISPNDESSCISSLSADDINAYVSHIASRKDDNLPHQITIPTSRKPKIPFPENIEVGENNYSGGAVQSAGEVLENRYYNSQQNVQGRFRPLDQKCLPVYHQKTISSTTVMNKPILSRFKIGRRKQVHPPVSNDNTYCDITTTSNGSTSITSKRIDTTRKRRTRTAKDEFRFFTRMIIPAPLKGMMKILIKKKSHDLKRSGGYLT